MNIISRSPVLLSFARLSRISNLSLVCSNATTFLFFIKIVDQTFSFLTNNSLHRIPFFRLSDRSFPSSSLLEFISSSTPINLASSHKNHEGGRSMFSTDDDHATIRYYYRFTNDVDYSITEKRIRSPIVNYRQPSRFSQTFTHLANETRIIDTITLFQQEQLIIFRVITPEPHPRPPHLESRVVSPLSSLPSTTFLSRELFTYRAEFLENFV